MLCTSTGPPGHPSLCVQAPVPFVLGVLYKTPEVRSKCGGLVRCAGGAPP